MLSALVKETPERQPGASLCYVQKEACPIMMLDKKSLGVQLDVAAGDAAVALPRSGPAACVHACEMRNRMYLAGMHPPSHER